MEDALRQAFLQFGYLGRAWVGFLENRSSLRTAGATGFDDLPDEVPVLARGVVDRRFDGVLPNLVTRQEADSLELVL